VPVTLTRVAVLDFSGNPGKLPLATLTMSLEGFLADLGHLERLRPHTVRAYRYELTVAAADPRFARPLDDLRPDDLGAWLARAPAAASIVGRTKTLFQVCLAAAVANLTLLAATSGSAAIDDSGALATLLVILAAVLGVSRRIFHLRLNTVGPPSLHCLGQSIGYSHAISRPQLPPCRPGF
jgi:hypothetical protein